MESRKKKISVVYLGNGHDDPAIISLANDFISQNSSPDIEMVWCSESPKDYTLAMEMDDLDAVIHETESIYLMFSRLAL